MRKIFILPIVFIFVACVSNRPAVETAHNARTGLDWEGLYSGTIPAASGPGIEVQITLNLDQTFQLRYHYIDKPDSDLNISGLFTWDDAKDVIILNTFATGSNTRRASVPPFYKVSLDELLQLDLDGNTITGNFAEMYVLKKSIEKNSP